MVPSTEEAEHPAETVSPTPVTTLFPHPTDIFILNQDWGTWHDVWVKGEIPKLVSKTRATAIHHLGGQAVRIDPDYERSYRHNMDMAHKWGMKDIIWLSPADIEHIEDIEPKDKPTLLEAVCIDIDGNKIRFHATGIYQQCTNNPVWREFLLKTAKRSIDWGGDGIAIDEWPGTFHTLDYPNGGCFCVYCTRGFREYLKEKYNPQELESLGIEDIDSFDYGDFIRERYLTMYKDNRYEVPLIFDFQDYQMESIKDFWHEFIGELREHGRAQGKDIYFSANTAELLPPFLPIQDELDYLSPEVALGYPPNGRSIPLYKIASSLGKPAFTSPVSFRSGTLELMTRPDITTLWKIYTAEAYSSGGLLVVPYGFDLWWAKEPSQVYPNMEELSNYYGFIHNNGPYYENLVSTSKIGVLYSYPSARWSFGFFIDDFYGVSNLLLDAHFQYDVLFSGDDDWIEDELSLEALNKFEVIILPNVRNLSDSQVSLLLSYMDSGGHIIGFGEIGNHDEKGHKVDREQLLNLLVRGVHSYGRGQFVYMEGQPGSDYLYNRHASTRDEFTEVLKGLRQPNVVTDANENVALLKYWSDETRSIVLHLINYDYDLNTQSMNPQTNINFEVTLSDQLRGKDLEVYYVSPDWSGVQELAYVLSEGGIKFRVPRLDFYGVVSIREE